MAADASDPRVQLSASGDIAITGDVVGRDKIVNQSQVAHGQYVVQIGNVNGGVVNVQSGPPAVRPRPTPVLLRPRPFRNLLGREAEIQTALTEAGQAIPVEFYGEPGVGKTALLRRLAHPDDAAAFPAGVVHLSALQRPLADFLQSLYDAFYESNPPTVVTEAEIRHGLQAIRALILVDDAAFTRDEVEALLNTAPNCAFILASANRTLWGEGRAIALPGLPPGPAVQLLERELGQDLPAPEEALAEQLAAAVGGRPLALLQAAAIVKTQGQTLAAVVSQITSAAAATTQAAAALTEAEARILAVLAPMNGAPVPVEHVTAITALPEAERLLEGLVQRGLVQRHSPRYSLRTPDLEATLKSRPEYAPTAVRALRHFITWASQPERPPEAVLAALGPMRQLVAWAAEHGHPAEAVQLARLTEAPLILLGHWEAWRSLLESALRAARAAGLPRQEGYFLHQLGSRALCRGEAELARQWLEAAFRLRQAIGDTAGAALSRGNLGLLPPPVAPPPPAAPALGAGLAPAAAVVLVVGALMTALAVSNAFQPALAPTATVTATASATRTHTHTAPPPTPTPSATVLPTATPSATFTATASPVPSATASPTATETATETPTATPTATNTRRPRPTATRTITPSPTRGALEVSFTADAATVATGGCTTLRWRVANADQVFLYGGEYGGLPGVGVVGVDSRPACPREDETYGLRVFRDGQVTERLVTIRLAEGTPPPAPSNLAPDDVVFNCPTSVVLSWDPVADASGIRQYDWALTFSADGSVYAPHATGVSATPSAVFSAANCGYYRLRVRAVDNAGNSGPFSSEVEFAVLVQ